MSETRPFPEYLEPLSLSRETQAVVNAVLAIAPDIVRGQAQARHTLSDKDDPNQTPVTDWDVATNVTFNEMMLAAFGGKARVEGEELSLAPTVSLEEGEDEIIITVDTIDGTGEYAATVKNQQTGDPLDPRKPLPAGVRAERILPHERSTCTGASIFKNGKLWAGIVYNPFTKQLVIADRDLGGTFLVPAENVEANDITAGQRLTVSNQLFEAGSAPWDCAVWPGAPVDVQFIAELAGNPRNKYSAISQAVDIALGKSVGAIFGGDTLHDVAPSVAVTQLAGGSVFRPDGTPVTMDNLLESPKTPGSLSGRPQSGFVYTTPAASEDLLRALHADREKYPFVAAADGWFFSPVYTGTKRQKTIEDLVAFETIDGVVQPGRIAIGSFGYSNYHNLTKRDFKEVRRRTRALGGSFLSYSLKPLDPDMPILLGRVHVWQPNRMVEVLPGVTMPASELALSALRSMVAYRLRQNDQAA